MRKIKILHIIKSLGRGGAEMLLPETLKLHNRERFEFHYIYFLPWKDQMVENIENSGGDVKCFPAKNNLELIWQYRKVIKYCRNHQIELIHCHLPWAGFLGRIVFRRTGIPVLYTEHNMQERYHMVTRKINKITFNSQSMCFGVSKDVTRSIKENIEPAIPIKTLLNGANTDTFRNTGSSTVRSEYGIPEDAVVIGNVAVFRFQKRLVEWLRTFKSLKERNKNVFGIIVGSGPLEKEINEEFRRLDLQGSVFFPGLQTEVKPYLDAMDIFMMSSSFEGLPIALLEAMSMKCAVVSTNAGGIKEVIRQEQDGLLCDVEEWEKLSGLCQYLIDHPGQLKYYKTAARERVLKSFSLRRMVDELESYYEVMRNSQRDT